MPLAKRFVYIIRSVSRPDTYYVGLTSDVGARLCAHNRGASRHTAAQRPWKPLVVVEFDEEEPAVKFAPSGRSWSRIRAIGGVPVVAVMAVTHSRALRLLWSPPPSQAGIELAHRSRWGSH